MYAVANTQQERAMASQVLESNQVASKSELHELYGEPLERAVKKQLNHLDKHCRGFIALSPFLVLATSASDGSCDASPRGDAPGFVAVIDEKTLLLPDRRGNNRVDSLENVTGNPHVGLLFLVPGMNETLRVNGTASVTTDPALLDPLAVRGQSPRTGLLVTVEEAYLQCGKALIRSDLWNAEKQIDRSTFPSLGQMMADQIGGIDATETQCSVEDGYVNRLY
jgi:PPOX class probable FMN-dependent enzyme